MDERGNRPEAELPFEPKPDIDKHRTNREHNREDGGLHQFTGHFRAPRFRRSEK